MDSAPRRSRPRSTSPGRLWGIPEANRGWRFAEALPHAEAVIVFGEDGFTANEQLLLDELLPLPVGQAPNDTAVRIDPATRFIIHRYNHPPVNMQAGAFARQFRKKSTELMKRVSKAMTSGLRKRVALSAVSISLKASTESGTITLPSGTLLIDVH